MTTRRRIQELSRKVINSDGPEFEAALTELANALDLYNSIEDDKENSAAAD